MASISSSKDVPAHCRTVRNLPSGESVDGSAASRLQISVPERVQDLQDRCQVADILAHIEGRQSALQLAAKTDPRNDVQSRAYQVQSALESKS
jgi:hypothetical protein